MGTRNWHHKRKAKAAHKLARQKAKRAPYARILIVCEGKKTEPHYFTGLKDKLELNTANVEISGRGNDPKSIVTFAKTRYDSEKKQGNPFDHVYCVFDKDQHPSYQEALQQIWQLRHRAFHAIPSVPCFEYFLLLHYCYTTKSCKTEKQVEYELKKYIPKYCKGDRDIFCTVRSGLDTAITNAEQALAELQDTGAEGPSTRAHELVQYMQEIANTPR